LSRGLFGRAADPAQVEKVLRQLSLWDKKDSPIQPLSGGMKRRVLIAKALSHEPSVLFLDEPTAGVGVELRHDMWQMGRRLREAGTTVILTTHYIEEAEEMADRIGVIRKGELIVVEEKQALMQKLGKKQLSLQLRAPLAAIPAALAGGGALGALAGWGSLQRSYQLQAAVRKCQTTNGNGNGTNGKNGPCPDPYALVRAQRLDCIGRNGRWDDATLTCQPGPSLDPCAFLTGKAKIRCQESGIVPLPPSLPTADLVPLSVFVPPPSEPVPIYTPPPPGGGGGGPIKPF